MRREHYTHLDQPWTIFARISRIGFHIIQAY